VIRAKKSLGQHFLADKNIARKIIRALDVQPGDCVLEIGAGTGALTEHLAQTDARTTALEIDSRAVEYLQERRRTEEWRNVEVVHGNVLDYDIERHFPEGQVKVVGNLPYNISSPILFRLFRHKEHVRACVAMMQLEVARRICAGPGSKDYGILSVLTQVHAAVELLFKVSPNVFRPKPDVWSAVIGLNFQENRLAGIEPYESFENVVKAVFGVRRKTVRNALRRARLLPDDVPAEISGYMSRRAEELTIDDLITLSSRLQTE
jgi:16S rRNA (adenine1518-N6/adenine1519-N6)-dimethyltransferase